jgi:hypothetical protein
MIVNGQSTKEWEYIRMTTNHWSSAPVEDLSSPAIRCYEDKSQTPVKTMSVAAGSTVTFKSSNTMGHPGPVLFYMAKAPGGVSNWDGSGKVWFKVYESGATSDSSGVHFKTGKINENTSRYGLKLTNTRNGSDQRQDSSIIASWRVPFASRAYCLA